MNKDDVINQFICGHGDRISDIRINGIISMTERGPIEVDCDVCKKRIVLGGDPYKEHKNIKGMRADTPSRIIDKCYQDSRRDSIIFYSLILVVLVVTMLSVLTMGVLGLLFGPMISVFIALPVAAIGGFIVCESSLQKPISNTIDCWLIRRK